MPRCRLCEKRVPRLERSHVVPRFVLRECAPDGRRQTERLLCRVCEQTLGRVETLASQTDDPTAALALLSVIVLRAHCSRRTKYASIRVSARQVTALKKLLLLERERSGR